MKYSEDLIQKYSEYLTIRSFYTDHPVEPKDIPEVKTVEETKAVLKERLGKLEDTALLLSGGMDSAILLPFMPKSTIAYTVHHNQLDEDNEVEIARKYCEKFNIQHKVIAIEPEEYMGCMDDLMINKGMPLSPAEPIIYLASKVAVDDGFKRIVTGAGADACHGGFTELRKEFTLKGYIKRLERSYGSPKKLLNSHSDISNLLESYLKPEQPTSKNILHRLLNKNKILVDTKRFLSELSVERFAFDNAINLSGAEHITPLREITYNFDEEKNMKEPKYFIQDIYRSIYDYNPPKKLGLQKPKFLLKDYQPSNFDLYKEGIRVNKLRFPQKFLIYCLERFEQLRLDGKIDLK